MQNKDESELIAHSLSGNHQAYAELVDRYKNAVYHHCFAIVRDEDVAEDIAQETFITGFYKLALYKPEFKFSTWLFKIATNKALNWLKQNAKVIVADDELLATIASTLPSPETEAKYSELHQAVKKLRPKYQAVISLYYWQGLSYAEIATVLASPEGSVKGWIARAKQELKKELA
ncbi:MAG TPA: sigma-70 family RNA polymerase sigma factor [Verrucomicrobiae bacterium]|nr:sigma-70 family RNA polymerase sigma factor [Verrucomicrobiae bacterium]